MQAVFLWKKRLSKMTKKEFKDTFETVGIALICTLFVISANKKCSNMTQKETTAKTEKVQNIKKHVTALQKVR